MQGATTVSPTPKTVATDTIWDTAGDLVQATGADAAAKLPIGTAGQVLTVNGGATALAWATPSAGAAVANPGGGAQVDLTGANGVLTTALRGDVTLILNQGIAPTWTAPHIFSVAGAASAPALRITGLPFAGTGTTSFPQFYITVPSATASTTLTTAGAAFGINNHGTSDAINVLHDGVTRFKIGATTGVTITGSGNDGTTQGLRVLNSDGTYLALITNNGTAFFGYNYTTSAPSVVSQGMVHCNYGIYEAGTNSNIGGGGSTTNYIGGTTIFRKATASYDQGLSIVGASGLMSISGTLTAAGTTGAQTINKPQGSVNFAAGASTLVVTNSLCGVATTYNVFPVVYGADATGTTVRVTKGTGSFTFTLIAAATSEIAVGWIVIPII